MKKRDTNLKAMRDNFFGAAGWDDLGYEEWIDSMNSFFEKAANISKKGSAMIMFMSIIKVETIIGIAQKHNFYYKTTGVWHKLNPMPRNMNLHFINSNECWIYFVYDKKTGVFNNEGQAIHDFFETSVTPASEKKYGKHPTQKPLSLMEKFIDLLTNRDDLVFDPFMGSGSSGVAALNKGRRFVGAEINAEYCEVAEKRMRQKDI